MNAGFDDNRVSTESVPATGDDVIRLPPAPRFRPPGTAAGAQEIFNGEVPYGKYFLGPGNMPGVGSARAGLPPPVDLAGESPLQWHTDMSFAETPPKAIAMGVNHSDTTLYISLVIIYRKSTGWFQNDFNVHGYQGHDVLLRADAACWRGHPLREHHRPGPPNHSTDPAFPTVNRGLMALLYGRARGD